MLDVWVSAFACGSLCKYQKKKPNKQTNKQTKKKTKQNKKQKKTDKASTRKNRGHVLAQQSLQKAWICVAQKNKKTKKKKENKKQTKNNNTKTNQKKAQKKRDTYSPSSRYRKRDRTIDLSRSLVLNPQSTPDTLLLWLVEKATKN